MKGNEIILFIHLLLPETRRGSILQEPISNICKVDVNFVVIGEHLETYAEIRYKPKSEGIAALIIFIMKTENEGITSDCIVEKLFSETRPAIRVPDKACRK